MRILPRVDDDVNEEWISDKTRHVVDGPRTQRLDQPYIREHGRLGVATWPAALEIARRQAEEHPEGADRRHRRRPCRHRGDLRAQESDDAPRRDPTLIAGRTARPSTRPGAAAATCSMRRLPVSRNPTRCCSIGANPRMEAVVLISRIRKRWRAGVPIRSDLIGERTDLHYPLPVPRAGPETLAHLAAGKHPFADALKGAQNPADHSRRRRAGASRRCGDRRRWRRRPRRAWAPSRMAGTVSRCRRPWRRGSAHSISLAPSNGGMHPQRRWRTAAALDVVFLLGADEVEIAPGASVVYPGTHGDSGAHRADVILPGPPTRRSPASTSIPRAACKWRRGPHSRPARRGRLGDPARAVGRRSASGCPMTCSRNCGRRCPRRIRSSQRIDQIAAGRCGRLVPSLRTSAARRTRRRLSSPDRRLLLPHQSDRAGVGPDGRVLGDRGRKRCGRTAVLQTAMSSDIWTQSGRDRAGLAAARDAGAERSAARHPVDRGRLHTSTPTARSGRRRCIRRGPNVVVRWDSGSCSPT